MLPRSPFLKIGVTFAAFKIVGYSPVEIILLNISQIGPLMWAAAISYVLRECIFIPLPEFFNFKIIE